MLLTAYGEGAANSILRKLKGDPALIPSPDHLAVGDVILTRHSKKFGWLPTVETYQRRNAQFQSGEAATWSHAMLYVGRMHVVESTNHFKIGPLEWKSGIRVAPMVHDDVKTEYLILRRRDSSKIPGFEQLVGAAAVYALMDYALRRRTYGYDRATAVVVSTWPRIFSGLRKFFPNRLNQAIICSEYVLECLAIGATMLTDEYNNLGTDSFFLPAHFFVHPDFDHLPMKFVQVKV